MKVRAAIYCRLSKEDINKETRQEFSESIKNQEALLLQFAREQDFRVVKRYRDDDYSGLYEDRPGFEQLIEDARSGVFQVVIAKTQARFTRNMEHLEKYLHNEFIQWGIRFMGAVDHVDTAVKGNKKARQINGLVNEWYCEDLSESVKASYRIKQIQGEYLASAPPYGYIKDPKDNHHLIPDIYAAQVVRRIFSLYLVGFGKTKIARMLTEEGILRPSIYKREVLGLNYYNPHEIKSASGWSFQTVADILKNEVYIGHTVQNKYSKVSYKSKYKKKQPESEWVRVEHTHEPIIEEELFKAAQETIRMKRTAVDATPNKTIFYKKLFCADCGRAMTKTRSGNKSGPKTISYICKTYKAHGNALCSSHRIEEDVLAELVLRSIRKEGRDLLKEEDLQKLRFFQIQRTGQAFDRKLAEVEKQLEKTTAYKERLYEDLADGLLTGEEYLALKKKYREKETDLQKQMEKIRRQREETRRNAGAAAPEAREKAESPGDIRSWIRQFKNHMDIDVLNRETVEELIERIEIGKEKEITIHFKFGPEQR